MKKPFRIWKGIIYLIPAIFALNPVSAQRADVEKNVVYVDLFISANNTIYLETDKINFETIVSKVSDNIRQKPFRIDQKIVYRIFADKNLELGYIIDVNQKMNSAYEDTVRTERYLLETGKLNMDGPNWFKAIDMEDLKKVN